MYKLVGHEAVRCGDVTEWGKWFEKADRRVGYDKRDGIEVSTVFLGVDHSFTPGPPLLFQTMVFGGTADGEQDRYSTWDEAVEGHARMAAKVFPITK